ncbi:MAG: DNA-directed RNA polymerase subunit H [Candidatus Pacearchaeota archaeon]|nr:DNA-directed RNA polymerase subunit H [Candidatus Pacearchaeota archaeon]
MHILQQKHIKIKPEEARKLLLDLNISISQLPKISVDDASIPQGCQAGDIIKIERKEEANTFFYFRAVV